MDELHLVGRHGEPVNVSKEVDIIIDIKRQKFRPFGSAEKQNKEDDKADDASGSVGGNQLVIIVNLINIDRAPLREDVLRR